MEETQRTMTELTKFERALLLDAVDFYLRNKQVDPTSGQVPWAVEMSDLFKDLNSATVYLRINQAARKLYD